MVKKKHVVVEMCGAKNISKNHRKELKFCVWHQINMNYLYTKFGHQNVK